MFFWSNMLHFWEFNVDGKSTGEEVEVFYFRPEVMMQEFSAVFVTMHRSCVTLK